MKKTAVLFCLGAGIVVFTTSYAQDTAQTQRPLFFQVDFAVGPTQRVSGYFSAIARFYHEKFFVSLGTGGFNYKPQRISTLSVTELFCHQHTSPGGFCWKPEPG